MGSQTVRHEGNSTSGTNLVKAAADYNNDYGTLSTSDIQSLSNGKGVVIDDNSDTVGTPYDPATYADHVGWWDINNAFTTTVTTPATTWYSNRGSKDTATLQSGGKGTEVTVARAGIYYLKEVPTCYLRNYHQITFVKSTGALTGLYLLTAVDDTTYNSEGFVLKSEDNKEATIVKTFSITNSGTGKTITLTPSIVYQNVGLTMDGGGYLGYSDITDTEYFAEGSFTISPFWVTPDEVNVNGTSIRTVTISSLTKKGITKTDN